MYVLDSSAFINEYHTSERVATIPLVQEELEGEAAYRFDAMEGSGMHLHIPEANTVERIERAARETGDLAELSETDIRLVAAAFELDGRLVTDDYAMQNFEAELDELLEHFLLGDAVATGQHPDSPGLVVITHDRKPGRHTRYCGTC